MSSHQKNIKTKLQHNHEKKQKHKTIMFLILSSFFLLSTTNPQNLPPSSPCTQPSETLTNCKKLQTLGAEFGWKLHATNYTNTTRIDIYFGARLPKKGWMAWGVNPSSKPKMVGTRALIGIRYQNGSSKVMTYNVTAYTKHGCQLLPSDVDVVIRNMSSEYVADSGYLKMYATLFLDDLVYNVSRLNHVWQVGQDFVGSEMIMKHEMSLENYDSSETIDLMIGRSKSVERHRMLMRTVHGMLNIVGWGTLLPIGVIIARYCKKFPIKWKPWLKFHILCQVGGYVMGTIGWAIGLWLGHSSAHYSFHIHMIVGTLIFTLVTLQISALRLMPRSDDPYRRYWNIYHHLLGYAILIVVSVNIFQGIAILKPNQQPWNLAYLSIIAFLSSVTVFFEIFTWSKFLLAKANPPNV